MPIDDPRNGCLWLQAEVKVTAKLYPLYPRKRTKGRQEQHLHVDGVFGVELAVVAAGDFLGCDDEAVVFVGQVGTGYQ